LLTKENQIANEQNFIRNYFPHHWLENQWNGNVFINNLIKIMYVDYNVPFSKSGEEIFKKGTNSIVFLSYLGKSLG
jgi:hypothetical protein